MDMIVSLALLVMIFYPILSAVPSEAQSDAPTNVSPGPIAYNMLREYIPTEAGIHKMHPDRATWNDARNICLDEKAQLVVIETAVEEAMLLRHMKVNNMKSVWIGVHDMFEKKQWTTITGQRLYSLEYVHWGKEEPNGSGTGEHCVEMNMAGMNDLGCETETAFVCEKLSLETNIDIRAGSK